MPEAHYDIVVVGGSLGGVAAALAAARAGANVCLLEPSGWYGGQLTGQGVTKVDDDIRADTTSSTASYRAFRQAIRDHYLSNYRPSAAGAAQPYFNPGGPTTEFAMEPAVAHSLLARLLGDPGNLHPRTGTRILSADTIGDRVISVTAAPEGGSPTTYIADIFLDATDLGDLLPLCGDEGVDWFLGCESDEDMQEPGAPPVPRREWIQPITVPIALELRPSDEDHTITPPPNYAALRHDHQYKIEDGCIDSMFAQGDDMWKYRRFIYAANFDDSSFPNDLSMINTGSNDAIGEMIPTGDPDHDREIVERARQATLGYLYWLQTECPHPGSTTARGYPQLKPRPDIFGTPDATAPLPYIRESRRIRALKTIRARDIQKAGNPGPRAPMNFPDSCGLGHYHMDVHPLRRPDAPTLAMGWQGNETWPYQIPVSALIPVRLTNLLAASKNLGVTHLTNGAYRLHKIEWNIGEAAGTLAAFCIARGVLPRDVPGNGTTLRDYQHRLLERGVPLFWWTDVLHADPAFAAAHLLGLNGLVVGYTDHDRSEAEFRAHSALADEHKQAIQSAANRPIDWPPGPMTRGLAARWLVTELGL